MINELVRHEVMGPSRPGSRFDCTGCRNNNHHRSTVHDTQYTQSNDVVQPRNLSTKVIAQSNGLLAFRWHAQGGVGRGDREWRRKVSKCSPALCAHIVEENDIWNLPQTRMDRSHNLPSNTLLADMLACFKSGYQIWI